jgi:predicted dehydrogenase
MERVRTALVGCGKVGGIHAAALATLPESEFVAVCDDQAARAEAFAAKYGVRAFTDVQRMMDETLPGAVLIATPHPLHAGPAITAAECGAHVLVEKPMAATLADCDAMLAAATNGVKIGVISQRRWYEPVLRMKEAIDAGKIGKPALGVFQMYSWRDPSYYRSDPWRGRWDTEGGGVLVNQSPHQLDLLQWLMGAPIVEISGSWSNINHPEVEVDDTAVATIRFAAGGLGAIVTSVAQKPGLFTKVHIHGSNGVSVGVETDRGATFIAGVSSIAEPPLNDLWNVPGEEHLLPSFQAEDRARFASIDATTHYHALQIRDFLRAVADGRQPAVTGEDGRLVVAMFTAIYRSHAERRPIEFQSLT